MSNLISFPNINSGLMFFVILLFICLFFLCREIFCWYFKINEVVNLLEQIEENTRLKTVKDDVLHDEVIDINSKRVSKVLVEKNLKKSFYILLTAFLAALIITFLIMYTR